MIENACVNNNKTGQITNEFEELLKCIHDCNDIIKALYSELSPILSESEDEAEKALNTPQPHLVPLAGSLRIIRFKAEESKKILHYMLSHMEL